MKIALLGSAPSSLPKAPQGDPTWQIWACSPGCYPVLARVDEFFEIHRWEPGIVGKPQTQKPWFTPEYVQWLKTFPPRVWVVDPDAQKDIGYPRAQMLPWPDLVKKYGNYFWTSTLAYMTCMAIDRIQAARAARPLGVTEEDVVGYWGVDMAANEELYSNQRAALQFLLQMLTSLEISFYIPPESDLATPPPMYGVSECSHRGIKWLERKRELEFRMHQTDGQLAALTANRHSLAGALDDHQYHQTMWMHPGEDTLSFAPEEIFPWFTPGKKALIQERQPKIEAVTLEQAVKKATPAKLKKARALLSKALKRKPKSKRR